MGCSTPALPSSWKVIAFTTNMVLGLGISQIMGATLEHDAYETYVKVVTVATMWCLSFIMINVGYEFTIDKSNLREYFNDYCIAMTAAGFPWMFVGFWFFYALGTDMKFDESLLIARFAAPTSAGILFSMLDAAGLKDTWVYQKARILAIFDDLDTIILMIPLKILMVGFKWELTVIVGIMAILLIFSWVKLHALKLPYSWPWTLFYAAVVALVCKLVHHFTEHDFDMEPIHIEVLLPAFVIGTVIDTPCARHELKLQRQMSTISQLRRSSRSSGSGGLASISGRRPSIEELIGNSAPDDKGDDGILRDLAKCSTGEPESLTSICTGTIPEDEQLEEIHLGDDDAIRKSAERAQSTRVAAITTPPGWVLDVNSLKVVGNDANSIVMVKDTRNAGEYEGSARKGSKHSVASKQSITSSRSSRSLTRYGHAREDIVQKVIQTHGEPEAEPIPETIRKHKEPFIARWEEKAQLTISLVFMVLVGLSMPALIGKNAEDETGGLGAGAIIFHVICVSILMIAGKMFPLVCYRDESDLKGRTALCMGMCPRGEVGASIIVISLELGVSGPAIIIAMCALAGNLIMSGGFIAIVKTLLRDAPPFSLEGEQVIQTPVVELKA